MNTDKRIIPKVLIACEESQTVCAAFRARGFEAYSCDILEPSGGHPEWHILGDVLPILNGNCAFQTMDGTEHGVVGDWDLIIAHPPCTYLSNAGACRLYPKKGQLDMERYQKGLEGKEFFLKFMNTTCPHVCIENPVSSKVFEMPQHSQEIQPYQFDHFGEHPYTKKTRLWLIGLPQLRYTTPNEQPKCTYVPAGTGRKDRSKYGAAKRGDDAKNRAKFFRGIADAMATQWGDYILGKEIT